MFIDGEAWQEPFYLHHRMHKTSGPVRAHALNGVPHVTVTFSHGEGFKASLLFKHNFPSASNAYSQKYIAPFVPARLTGPSHMLKYVSKYVRVVRTLSFEL